MSCARGRIIAEIWDMDKKQKTDALRETAWIGDAVLALWARRWILEQANIAAERRTEVFIAMTSNRFLMALGEPTSVEARIGEVYQEDGLEAAFAWMNEQLLPLFKKQMLNADRGKRGAKRS